MLFALQKHRQETLFALQKHRQEALILFRNIHTHVIFVDG